MSLIGFSFNSINAHASGKQTENVEIKIAPPAIEKIEEKDLHVLGIQNAVKVDFKFSTHYTPDVGAIELTGEVIYKVEDAKKFIKSWGQSKDDEKITADILNIIFRRCMLKTVDLSDTLKLPPPVMFPSIMPSKEEK